MAFKLKLENSYIRPKSQTAGSAIFGARQQLRWIEHFGYFQSPKMHMMSAAFTFLLGVTLATLRPAHLVPGGVYDMMPIGSITGAAAPGPKAKSCE